MTIDRKKIRLPQTNNPDNNTNSNIDHEIEITLNDPKQDKPLNEQRHLHMNSCDKTRNELFGHTTKKNERIHS